MYISSPACGTADFAGGNGEEPIDQEWSRMKASMPPIKSTTIMTPPCCINGNRKERLLCFSDLKRPSCGSGAVLLRYNREESPDTCLRRVSTRCSVSWLGMGSV